MKKPAHDKRVCFTQLTAVAGRQQQSGTTGGAEHQQTRLQPPLRIPLCASLANTYPSRLHRANSIQFPAPGVLTYPCPSRQAAHLCPVAARRQLRRNHTLYGTDLRLHLC